MLPRQLKEVQFTAGLNTKGDQRAQPEQQLDIALNVEFDDVGGLRCRYPFDTVRTNIIAGGGAISNARKIVAHGDELLLWTSDTLYTWSEADAAWVSRGTHLAVSVDERERFPSPSDTPQVDRCQLGIHVMYAWTDGTHVYAAITDLLTGAVVMAPTLVDAASTIAPRIVACSSKWLLFYRGASDHLVVKAINPASLAASFATSATNVTTAATGTNYDVMLIPGAGGVDTAIAVVNVAAGTSYTICVVTAGLAVSRTSKARASVGAIAIAMTPDGVSMQILRDKGTGATGSTVQGDLLTVAGNVDVFVNQDIGTVASGAVLKMTGAFRSVASGGHYLCNVFWTWSESSSGGWQCATNTVNDAGTIGTQSTLVRDASIASRAFDVGSHTFLWTVFAGGGNATGLQNCLLLMRDDGFIAAKALAGNSAGLLPDSTNILLACLPAVQLVGGGNEYAFLGIERRRVSTQNGDDYARRAPRDVLFAFDTNEARRAARLGATLYIAAGEVIAYDGSGLVEVGYHVYPWSFGVGLTTGTALPDGKYTYKVTGRWDNANGERDRSTTVKTATLTVTGGPKDGQVGSIIPIYTTKKTNAAIEVWRTELNPTADSPFFLATSTNPTATGNNGYLVNDTTLDTLATFQDDFDDATIATKEEFPVDLEPIAPPASKLIFATDTRLFLAGIAGNSNQIWYSKLRTVGFVAQFADELTIDVPTDGGAITAIGALDGTLIVWCETATYSFGGGGFDNTGAGANYSLARIISTDLGCVSAEACALADDGFFVKTNKGWFGLDRALNYTYIGAGVDVYDAETVLATTVLTARHQVRVLTSARMLVFDTLQRQWAETSVNDGLDLTVWSGQPVYLTATGTRAELATWDGYAGLDYTLTSMDVQTGWIKFGAMQARVIVDYVQLLGELRSTCVIRKRLARDYAAVSPGAYDYTTDKTWTPSPGVIGSAFQVRQSPRFKRCEVVKARFTVTHPDGVSPLGGPGVRITSIAAVFAAEPTAYGALGAAQKQ